MSEIAGLILPLFGLIFLGYIVARITRQPAEAMGWLNTFIIYAALPALFFKLLSKTPVEQLASWDFVLSNLAVTFSLFLLIFLVGACIRRSTTPEATIQGLAAAYGNIGYMGPAVAILTFGERAAVPVALIVCFENVMHFIVAPTFMAVAGGDKRNGLALARDIAKKVMLHPFIVSTILGMAAAVSGIAIPTPVEGLVNYLAQAAAPCALFAMGVSLALRPLRKMPLELSYIILANLVLHPILMYVALSWIGDFDPIWMYTAVLLAALPTATNVFVLAQQYGVWIERASATILLTTILSVFTVSAFVFLITQGLLPPDLFPGR
ncbi:AEC family transporter [Sneathiella chinensis]|uniref:Malonate transporter n=1 Tax=Sneathiella chinensis TaxID=349750 RepID=A0ABQ5U4T7_9PROT|nr:AEC family transporter [Sneathiella chinensis]GLQ06294.1 malonate transporter [Sneathiella chinensis]